VQYLGLIEHFPRFECSVTTVELLLAGVPLDQVSLPLMTTEWRSSPNPAISGTSSD
jgi:hypothetical protein